MIYRTPITLFLAALALLIISSHDTAASQLHDYPKRPPREIAHELGVLKMADFGSQRLSVTFWSGDDAVSRMENIREAHRAKHDPTLTHIGVNLSDSRDIFNAYLRRDRLTDDPLQLRVSGDNARTLLDTYGYRTLYQ